MVNLWKRHLRLILPLVLLGVSLLYPLLDILETSVSNHGHVSLANFRAIFSSIPNLIMFRNTALVALVVVFATLVLGYALAILIHFSSVVVKLLLLAALVYPFFTSVLVKSFSFIVILGPTGPIIRIAKDLGLGNIHLLYTWFGVVIGMTYSLLPYMALTLYASVREVDEQVLLAARNLGASRVRTFFSVLLPMTQGGIIGGCLLVFVLSFGYYITPALLGGPSNSMVAMAVASQALTALNFGVASALAIGIVAVVGIMFTLYMRLVGIDALIQGGKI